MLSPSQIATLHRLPTVERQQKFLELSEKIANLEILKPEELDELIVLRDTLQNDAENLLREGKKRYMPVDENNST